MNRYIFAIIAIIIVVGSIIAVNAYQSTLNPVNPNYVNGTNVKHINESINPNSQAQEYNQIQYENNRQYYNEQHEVTEEEPQDLKDYKEQCMHPAWQYESEDKLYDNWADMKPPEATVPMEQ